MLRTEMQPVEFFLVEKLNPASYILSADPPIQRIESYAVNR